MFMMPILRHYFRSKKQLLIGLIWIVVLPFIFYIYTSYSNMPQSGLYNGSKAEHRPITTKKIDNSLGTHATNGNTTNSTGIIYRNKTTKINDTDVNFIGDTSERKSSFKTVTKNPKLTEDIVVKSQSSDYLKFNVTKRMTNTPPPQRQPSGKVLSLNYTKSKYTITPIMPIFQIHPTYTNTTIQPNVVTTKLPPTTAKSILQSVHRLKMHTMATNTTIQPNGATIIPQPTTANKILQLEHDLNMHPAAITTTNQPNSVPTNLPPTTANKILRSEHGLEMHPAATNTTDQPNAIPTNLPSTSAKGSLSLSSKPSKIVVDCSRMWVSSHIAGRLGNQMCEYAHLLVLHFEYGVQVGLLSPMHNSLKKIFPHLSAQLLPKKCIRGKKAPTHQWPTIDSSLRNKTLTRSVIIRGSPCDASRLWRYREIWRREFVFAPKTEAKARDTIQKSLDTWKKKNDSTTIPLVVGVHVRRTDYINYVKGKIGGEFLQNNYFHEAFKYFREKYGEVVFLVTSDDRIWCRINLAANYSDVIITPKGSNIDDMALLSMSSHLIMSLGTYGFWAGSLSKGTVTFPLKVSGKKSEYFMTKNLKLINSTDVIRI